MRKGKDWAKLNPDEIYLKGSLIRRIIKVIVKPEVIKLIIIKARVENQFKLVIHEHFLA